MTAVFIHVRAVMAVRHAVTTWVFATRACHKCTQSYIRMCRSELGLTAMLACLVTAGGRTAALLRGGDI